MRILRTPDPRFADLPGFPQEPRHAEVPDGDGGTLRMAWVEDGPADGLAVAVSGDRLYTCTRFKLFCFASK